MKALISILIFMVFMTGCSEDPRLENFKFQITPANPPIIFAGRTLTYVLGEEVIEIDIKGPWMLTGFNVVNDNDRTITLVSLEYRVTGPDGKIRVGDTFSYVGDDPQNVFGVFKAEGDINCDGFVTDDDLTAIPPQNCDLDNANPSYIGTKFYIHDLMQGVKDDELDEFRGGSFSFQVRLEGWFGGPDNAEESFFKEVYFSVGSNL